MKVILITMGLALSLAMPTAQARTIKPYDPKPQSFEVDGKDVTSAEATVAYLGGKIVKLCKAMSGVNATKTYRLGGKEVKGAELKTCVEQELVATKSGTGFKKKP